MLPKQRVYLWSYMQGKWVFLIEHWESNYAPPHLSSFFSGCCHELGSTWPRVPLPFLEQTLHWSDRAYAQERAMSATSGTHAVGSPPLTYAVKPQSTASVFAYGIYSIVNRGLWIFFHYFMRLIVKSGLQFLFFYPIKRNRWRSAFPRPRFVEHSLFAFYSLQHHVHIRHKRDYNEQKANQGCQLNVIRATTQK